MSRMTRVASLMNATLDSAVSSLLLKKKGYDVIGISMRNNFVDKDIQDKRSEYVEYVAKRLDIPWREYSPSDMEWSKLKSEVEDDIIQGFSPAVDVLYHKHILFGALFNHVKNQVGADKFATSNFARLVYVPDPETVTESEGVRLLKAFDQFNDESFLLCQIPQSVLLDTRLPLGKIHKETIPKVAEISHIQGPPPEIEDGIATAVDDIHTEFVSNFKPPFKPCKVAEVTTREVLQTNANLCELHVGDTFHVNDQQYYIVEKDLNNAQVFVVKDFDHPSMYYDSMYVDLAHWIYTTPYHFYSQTHMMEVEYRMDVRQFQTEKCNLTVGAHNEWCGNDHMILTAVNPMQLPIPGNYCAFYNLEECIGSAKILKLGPSHFAMNYHKYRLKRRKAKRSRFSGFLNLLRSKAR